MVWGDRVHKDKQCYELVTAALRMHIHSVVYTTYDVCVCVCVCVCVLKEMLPQ